MSPLAPPQQVAAQIHHHANQPWPPRLVSPRRRPLPRAHERLLRQVVGVRRVACHPVTQSPDESFVSAEYLLKRRSGETMRGGGTHYCSSPFAKNFSLERFSDQCVKVIER